jgi:hypothetical protein
VEGKTQGKFFERCLKKSAKIARCWGKQRALDKHKREICLQEIVAAAQIKLWEDPDSELAQEDLRSAEEKLRELDTARTKWVDDIMQARWIGSGDKCSKPYFTSLKGMATLTERHKIRNGQGILVSGWEEIAQAAVEYFLNVLGTSQGINPAQVEQILKVQMEQISLSNRMLMDEELTVKELFEAVKDLATGKCPGEDGIPAEYFIHDWKAVGLILQKATLEGIVTGELHAAFTRGFIVLLAKMGDPTLFINKKPLTMLNVIYKVAAKAYQKRLTKVLQSFITMQQSAFLPGRSIHHSLLLMSGLLHHAESNDLDYLLMKLDVVKAFDEVEWGFLLALLEKYGFVPNCLSFLKALQASQTSAVRINGRLSNSFCNQRSLRQVAPCPICSSLQ